jgi:hypothetical protein
MIGGDQFSTGGKGRLPMDAHFKEQLGICPKDRSHQPIQKLVTHITSDCGNVPIVVFGAKETLHLTNKHPLW